MPWIETRLQLCGHIAIGLLQVDLLDYQRRVAPYNLHRGGQPFPGHRRAQNVVTIDHTLQGIDKSIQTRTAVERDQVRMQIDIAFTLQQIMEENAFLQRGQWIDVLNICRTTRRKFRNRANIISRYINEMSIVTSRASSNPEIIDNSCIYFFNYNFLIFFYKFSSLYIKPSFFTQNTQIETIVS